MPWMTLATLLMEGGMAAIQAVKEGTAEAEAKALDALDHIIAEAQMHVSVLRAALAQNKADAEKALHEKFEPPTKPE
jgi:hypothetical protein